MKNIGGSHTRFVPMYHPYYPQPAYNMKGCGNNYNSPINDHLNHHQHHLNNNTNNNNNNNNFSQVMFDNNGFYESESEESFPGSPETYADDALNSIDLSDLLYSQKHEQEELIQNNQLQMILEQVRREALQPLDVIEAPYGYNTSPIHTPECFEAVRRDTYPSPNYTQLQPALTPPPPTLQLPSPQPQHHHHIQQHTQHTQHTQQRQESMGFGDKIKVEIKTPTKPVATSPKRRASSEDGNDKIRLYEFVLQLLNEKRADCIRWLCPIEGEFEITNSSKIAQLWGEVKKNPTMTYEKFARALRHYYKLGILINYKHKEKLRYKFSQDILLKNKKSDM